MTQSAIGNRQSSIGWAFWLDATPRPGWQNMAIDLALLELAAESGQATFRVYRWDPFCLSFGRHEPALRRYGRDRIAGLGVDVVRRPTGGRAVWHARELTYAVAAPSDLGSLRRTYNAIHEVFVETIRSLGARASLADPPERSPGPGDGACFARPVGGEVLIDGKKVVGSAQLRMGNAFLQHGSLLLEDDQALVRELSGDPPSVASELPLSRRLGRTVAFGEAAEAVRQAAERWTGPWLSTRDSVPVLERADRHAGRFQDEAWTWER